MTDEMTAADEAVDETEQSIHSAGVSASTFQIQRAAVLTNLGTRETARCTATLIGPRHVLTAARCKPLVNERILFYTSSVASEGSARVIAAVSYPPGVNPNTNDFTDTNGKFADMAIVRLTANAPSTSIAATLAWKYPGGGDDTGIKVGAGDHQTPSSDTMLRQISDLTYSDHGNDGHFLTEGQQTNTGDEGGPFYYQNRVLGVLHGSVWEWANRDKYASTAIRLSWMLQNSGYAWSGWVRNSERIWGGTIIDHFHSSSAVCQYACDKTGSCIAYTHGEGYCRMYSNVTETLDEFFGYQTGRKF
jgi:hypothetical protein